MFSRDEMQRAIEGALQTMEGVALELYRRGREEAREELETVKRERDEARADLARSVAAWESAGMQGRTAHDAMLALAKERDEARAEFATLEHMLAEERENVDTLRARVAELEAEVAILRPWSVMLKRAHGALTDAGCVVPLEFDQSIEHAINDLARRATRAEQLFVDECNAHQETRTLLTDLYMKQLRADAAQMREYGISYAGVRTLLAEYDGGELSLGKVLELLRAAARELAKEEIAELKARITTLEAMKP